MNNVFLGRVTLQSESAYGDKKYVFYNIGQGQKNSWRPVNGGVLQNPYKNGGKFFQGDLCQYELNGKVTVLKTYVAYAAAAAADVSLKLSRDDFKHQPEVGDVLMVAPAALDGKGVASTVVKVDDSKDEYWTVTFDKALGAVAKDAILVEGASAGASVGMRVTEPNSMLDIDAVNKYPTNDPANNVIYSIAPVVHEIAYEARLAPLPACVKAVNRSRIKGLFEI